MKSVLQDNSQTSLPVLQDNSQTSLPVYQDNSQTSLPVFHIQTHLLRNPAFIGGGK
jgi:hypothetical protein